MEYRLQKGLTIIEAALVLAISTVVIAGVMMLFSNASRNLYSERVIAEMQTIHQSIVTLYASQKNYKDLTVDVILSLKSIPNRMVVNGNELRHSYNGDISIGTAQINQPDDSFFIFLEKLPSDACILVASHDYGKATIMEISGNSLSKPIQLPEIIENCEQPSGRASIRWTFKN